MEFTSALHCNPPDSISGRGSANVPSIAAKLDHSLEVEGMGTLTTRKKPDQHLAGADGVTDRLGGHVGVYCRGRKLGVAEQQLDNAHVGVGLAKLRRNVCSVGGFLTPAMCLAEVKARFS
jgi:hypothetical protein